MSLTTATAAIIVMFDATGPDADPGTSLTEIILHCSPVSVERCNAGIVSVTRDGIVPLTCRISDLTALDPLLAQSDQESQNDLVGFDFHDAALDTIWRALCHNAGDLAALMRAALASTHAFAIDASGRPLTIAIHNHADGSATGTTLVPHDPEAIWIKETPDCRAG